MHQDERVSLYDGGNVGCGNGGGGSSVVGTIAAIVTSVGGAVGIVRLSGPASVGIAGKVFRPNRKRRRQGWRPTSHVVEYGVAEDSHGNVVDEVR